MGRRDKDDGDWAEDGQPVIRGWMKGRAGRAPRGRLPDTQPARRQPSVIALARYQRTPNNAGT
jgi:hypothetical protein